MVGVGLISDFEFPASGLETVTLIAGLQSRFAAHVVAALTTCILEMKDAMYKRLPEVLLSLSKISATVHIAIPILSFLSSEYLQLRRDLPCANYMQFPVNNALKDFSQFFEEANRHSNKVFFSLS